MQVLGNKLLRRPLQFVILLRRKTTQQKLGITKRQNFSAVMHLTIGLCCSLNYFSKKKIVVLNWGPQ
jgi:hypothetical protein